MCLFSTIEAAFDMRFLAMMQYSTKRMIRGTMKKRKILLRKYRADQNVLASVWQAGTLEPSKYSTCLNSAMPSIGLEITAISISRFNSRSGKLSQRTSAIPKTNPFTTPELVCIQDRGNT